MKIVLFQALLAALSLLLIQGIPTNTSQAFLSGQMDLHTTLLNQPTGNIFTLPEPISPGDRLLLTIRHASIQAHFVETTSQDTSLQVTPLGNSNAVELKMNSKDANSNWKIRISYMIVHWPFVEQALTAHTLTLSSLPLRAELQNGMQIFAYEITQMKGEQNVAPQQTQIAVLLTGFMAKIGEYGSNPMARFMGNVNGMKIVLSVDRNGVQSCSISVLIIQKHKLVHLGLKMDASFYYFPRATSHLSTQILNQLQIYNSCAQGNNLAVDKECWSMRSLTNLQLLPLDQVSHAQTAPIEYPQRNLACIWVTCPCTDSRATVCYKDYWCNGCYVGDCIAGFYAPWGSTTCRACPAIANCVACRLPWLSSTPVCKTCNSGFTVISGACVPCPTTCTGCNTVSVSGSDRVSCTGCKATFSPQTNNGVTSCVCLSNQYLANSTCNNCPPACTICSSYSVCTDCVSGKYLQSGSCPACMPVCKTCLTGSTCLTCLSSLFTPVSGICTCNSPYLFDSNTNTCVLCSALQGNCTKCDYATPFSPSTPPPIVCVTPNPGFYVALNGSATPCIPYCTNCTANPFACDVPNMGYTFDGTSCVCSNGTYFFNGSCLACTTIMLGCDSCKTNPIPTATTCQVCSPIGYFNDTVSPVTGCKACAPLCFICNSLTDCVQCINSLIPVGGICTCDVNASLYYDATIKDCRSCNLVIFNCQTCASNGSTTVTCSSCGLGRYLAAGGLSCQSCPITCSECLNTSFCTQCRPGYDKVNDTCVCGPNCTDCQTNSTDQLCASCTLGPFSCNGCLPGYLINLNGTCSPCSLNFTACTACTATNCMECASPFVLTPSGCQCNNTDNMYLSVNGSTCLPCNNSIPNCTSCTNTGPTTPTTCTASVVGYFIEAGGQSVASCGGFCLTCSLNATNCGSCLPTYTMMVIGYCDCNNTNAYFYDPVTKGCLACSALIPNCLVCSPSGLNTSCFQCASKTYWNSTTLTCESCPSSCSDCSSSTTCVTCPDTFVLSETLPGWMVVGDCVCNTTSDAAYYDSITKTCQKCSYFYPSCASCSNTTATPNCSVCSDGTYLANGTCVNCPSSCATCSSPTTCTTCPGNLTLSGGECICDAACSQCKLLSTACVSCSISNGSISACLACEPGTYLSSPECIACPFSCATCTGPNNCLTCRPSYQFSAGACSCATSLGIFPNSTGACVLCTEIYYGCVECSLASGSTACLQCAPGYYVSGVSCLPCRASCNTCSISEGNCTTCGQGLILTNGSCLCSDAACTACNTTSPNCADCTYTILGTFTQCASCQPGFYLIRTICIRCPSDCLTCGSNGVCLTCPNTFQVLSGSCACNNAQALWQSAGQCKACTTLYPNCQSCVQNTSISQNVSCSACLFGYYSLNDSCVQSVCGDNAITSGETCDDGNTVNSDGCSQYCQIQANYLCEGQPSVCTINLNYHITLSSITASLTVCNQISISFQMDPVYPAYDTVNFRNMLTFTSNPNLEYRFWTYSGGIATYTFAYTDTLNSQMVSFFFSPKNLAINQTSSVPVINVTFPLLTNNNMAIVYYPPNVCQKKEIVRGLAKAVQYASYGTLAVSAFPSKIVGLQLFGVLQLAFLSTGNLDNVNTMLAPLMQMKGVHGFAMKMGKESKQRLLQSSYTPNRVQSIGYQSNFLRNCNVMLAIVVVVITVAFFLLVLTYCCRGCAPTLHKYSKRVLKEVLLTLILFNCFNFAYSAGIHFAYAPSDDSLYGAGTAAAILALVLPVVMALALMCTEDTGFGQFKEKFKPGTVERLYFVITILYRSGIGLYISTMNEDSTSTLIVMALSIGFLMYNLVNLPYAQAYHNYRANICHFAQAICLFVTMYYRSMKSSTPTTDVASIYGPAYLEMAAILISLVVSLVVLVYEVYIFVKECCSGPSNKKIQPQAIMTTENNENSKANIDEKEQKNNISNVEFIDLEAL